MFNNGRWKSAQFNSRLQPTQIALGTTQNGTDKLKLDFEYGILNTGNGQVIAGTNNGNVAKQTITVPTETRNSVTYDSFSATQYYVYDALNRIQIASENLTPQGQSTYQSWQQTFTYDRYGNRNFDEANTTTLPKNCGTSPNFTVCAADRKIVNPSISASNNRIIQDQDSDQQDDYLFDSSGNTTKDAQGRTFIYDGENKQTEVKDSTDQTIGRYFYDGDGKRVKKKAWIDGQWVETIFIYDAGGKLVAEYENQTPGSQVGYLTSDHLGSPRINTDANGLVTARHDYQPFGEEIARPSYSNDEIRKQFTSYERDTETDLDFAQARMYGYGLGRFTSPDPLAASANAIRPQSWNRYSYSYNNPLRFTDPSGMIASDYVDEDGNVIGSDGSKETKLYFVASEADRNTVIENRKAGNTTELSSLNSALELPNADVRQEIGVDAVKRTNQKIDGKKGFHEEGGAVYETANGQIAVPAKPGPNGVPGQSGGAAINVMDAADPNLMKQVTDTTPLLTYHVHPGGTKVSASLIDGKEARTIKGFKQEPSKDIDIPNAANRNTKLGYNIVVGAGSKMIGTTIDNKVPNGGQRVYFYNGSGVIGSMSINGFVKAGRR